MQVVENMYVYIYKYLSLKNRLKARGITVSFRDIRMRCYFSDLISFFLQRKNTKVSRKENYIKRC